VRRSSTRSSRHRRHILAQPIQGTLSAELSEVYRIAPAFKATVMRAFDAGIARVGGVPPAASA